MPVSTFKQPTVQLGSLRRKPISKSDGYITYQKIKSELHTRSRSKNNLLGERITNYLCLHTVIFTGVLLHDFSGKH